MREADAARFLRFVAVGALNTAFGYLVFAAGIVAGLPPEGSLLVATVVGVGFNFVTTGRLVFSNKDNTRLLRFVLCYGAVYVLNALALRGMAGFGLSPLVSQLILLPPVVVLTFAIMRLFVFREIER